MAQSNAIAHIQQVGFRTWENLAVAVPASGLTTLLQCNTRNVSRVFVQLDVTSNALDQFVISAKSTENGTATTLFNTTAHFTTLPAGGILKGTSGDLTTQAVGSGFFLLETLGIYEITVQASGNGAATVSIYGGGC